MIALYFAVQIEKGEKENVLTELQKKEKQLKTDLQKKKKDAANLKYHRYNADVDDKLTCKS